MRKDGKIKISYAVAAGVLLGSVSMTSLASPVAGVVGMASTDSATVASNSYSTLSGVSLTLANILSDASAAANNTSDVASNDTTTVEQTQQSEYANVAIAQVDNYVNIRSTPSEDGDVVGKLYNKSAATVLATEGDWYRSHPATVPDMLSVSSLLSVMRNWQNPFLPDLQRLPHRLYMSENSRQRSLLLRVWFRKETTWL